MLPGFQWFGWWTGFMDMAWDGLLNYRVEYKV